MNSETAKITEMLTILTEIIKTELDETNVSRSAKSLKLFIGLHHEQIKNSDYADQLQEHMSVYIVKYGIDCIVEYTSLFGNKFKDYVIPRRRAAPEPLEQPELPPMPAEDMINIDRWVTENSEWNLLRKTNDVGKEKGKTNDVGKEKGKEKGKGKEKEKEKQLFFKIGQIVGARDPSRQWWMSRILYMFTDPAYPYPWYYVSYEGWATIHREWISSPLRIRAFYAPRDKLYRSISL
jgi:hypothetical protein